MTHYSDYTSPGVFFCFPDAGHLLCLAATPSPGSGRKARICGTSSTQLWSGTGRNTTSSSASSKTPKSRDQYRVYGELINTYGYSLPERAKELTALNYYDGKEDTPSPWIPPGRPRKMLSGISARYNKLKRTYEALSQLIQETGERDLLSGVRSTTPWTSRENEDDLAQIKDELAGSGYIRRRPGQKKTKITQPTSPLYLQRRI